MLLPALVSGLLVGCSSAEDDAAPTTTETTVADVAAGADDAAAPDALAFDAEDAAQAAELLDTDEGRELFISGMSDQLGITREQAECFVDNTPPEAMESIGQTGMDSEQIAVFLEIMTVCEIPLSDLGG